MLKKFPDGQNQVFIMASQSKGHIHKFQFVEQRCHNTFGRFYPRLYTVGSLFRKKKHHPSGGVSFWYGIHAEGIRKIKCGADERRRRRLDGAEQ